MATRRPHRSSRWVVASNAPRSSSACTESNPGSSITVVPMRITGTDGGTSSSTWSPVSVNESSTMPSTPRSTTSWMNSTSRSGWRSVLPISVR